MLDATIADADARANDSRGESIVVISDADSADDSDSPVDAPMADSNRSDAVDSADDAAVSDAAPDHDASSPDDGSTVPIFPDCTSTSSKVPAVILDATITSAGASFPFCSCTAPYYVTIHRVMCGSLPDVPLHTASATTTLTGPASGACSKNRHPAVSSHWPISCTL